ncbi:MAG TPA: anion permease [Terracidiphilus sp.]|nr:anion permease [Terracidiphilus sp.]
MAEMVTLTEALPKQASLLDGKLKRSPSRKAVALFLLALASSLVYIGIHIAGDMDSASVAGNSALMMLAFALAIALGFEFVNGFHDTANAVAVVIYTHSMEPTLAVVWSGICNLAGVLFSTGTVAFAIIALLPVELILQVSSGRGFAMVFALLLAAILWNLATWWFGLPASSSHTLVGSIIGVGLANHLLNPRLVTSGVDWNQVIKVLKALLFSPLIGFVLAGLLILLARQLIRIPALYEAPKNNEPPPFPIRALMVFACTGVSFFHGSNDGQKGMGLIMLILIGTMPTAYALNHAISPDRVQAFLVASQRVEQILDRHTSPTADPPADPRTVVADYIRTRRLQDDTLPALRELVGTVDARLAVYRDFKAIPPQEQTDLHNDLYVASAALEQLNKGHHSAFTPAEHAELATYRRQVDKATKFIPDWVKVAVALALGLGTMVGWKRIVVTVGERIGKEPLTYAQGASAGLVAMGTIFAADKFGLPVSTTHILSSGVAGTMSANGSGLHLSTVRNIAAGWVFTLPAAAALSGLLYWFFLQFS